MFHVRDSQGVLRPFSFRAYNKYPVGKDDSSLRHLWYSVKQAQKTDTLAVFRLADFHVEVDVTASSETTNHGCNWDDLVYLGVGWYVKTKTNPLMFDSSYRMTNPCKEVSFNSALYSSELQRLIEADVAVGLAATSEPGVVVTHYDPASAAAAATMEARSPGIEPYYVQATTTSRYQRRVDPNVDFIRSRITNSYQQVRHSLGDSGGHSGVDAPDPVEPVGHPDNPTFIEIPNTFRMRTIPLEGTPIGSSYGVNRGGDGQGWPTYNPPLGHNPAIFDEPAPQQQP